MTCNAWLLATVLVSQAWADHLLDGGKAFDHAMVASYQHSVTQPELGVACDGQFARVAPGGFLSLDIGHRRHFFGEGEADLSVKAVAGARYSIAVARIGATSEFQVVATGLSGEVPIALGLAGEFQYVRLTNADSTELLVDCVWANRVMDHPVEAHDHH